MSTFSQLEIEKRAHHFYLFYGLSEADALRAAYNEQILKGKLANQGLCHFTFEKKNGEIRTVLATKVMSFIPETKHPNGKGEGYTPLQVRFFDVSIGEWRSCRLERLVKIDW